MPARFDAIVIGAGFSGLYALRRLRKLGVAYTAGIPEYRRRYDEIAAAGYTGFKLG